MFKHNFLHKFKFDILLQRLNSNPQFLQECSAEKLIISFLASEPW